MNVWWQWVRLPEKEDRADMVIPMCRAETWQTVAID